MKVKNALAVAMVLLSGATAGKGRAGVDLDGKQRRHSHPWKGGGFSKKR
jgi:hypothetical protein